MVTLVFGRKEPGSETERVFLVQMNMWLLHNHLKEWAYILPWSVMLGFSAYTFQSFEVSVAVFSSPSHSSLPAMEY